MTADATAAVGSGRPGAGTIAAAVLLPPLAVFLQRGFGPSFWIGLALTALFFLPGVAWALLALFRPAALPVRR